MGKLNDLLKKIKGMFNRNRALPAGTTEKIITDIVPENYEKEEKIEMETSQHQNFVSELKKQAEQYDLTKMPMEDAILKALEEKGLNPEFSKNPEFQKQMTQIFRSAFYEDGHTLDPEVAVKNLRSAIGAGIADYHFSITADGNLEYTKKNDGNSLTHPSIKKYFMLDQKGNLITSELSETSEYDDHNHKIVSRTKNQSVFDKYGIEQNKMRANYQQDMNDSLHSVIDNSLRIVTRLSGLATATETVYKNPVGINEWVNNPTSTDFYLSGQSPNDRVFAEISCVGQYPNELCCPVHSFDDLSEFKKLEADRKIHNIGEIKTIGPDTYDSLYSKYRCLPDAITPEEKNHKQEYINLLLKDATERSSALKKLAEDRGLIAKDEMAMEQE